MNNMKQSFPGDPAERDIQAKRNDTFTYPIRGWSNDGTPYDFTNHEFIMQVKNKPEDDTAIIDITNSDFSVSQDSIGVDDGVNNIVDIEHDSLNMDISPGEYYYDIQMTDPNSKVFTIQEGKFIITQDVSR